MPIKVVSKCSISEIQQEIHQEKITKEALFLTKVSRKIVISVRLHRSIDLFGPSISNFDNKLILFHFSNYFHNDFIIMAELEHNPRRFCN